MAANNYVTLQNVKDYMPQNQVSTSNVWDTYVTTLCTNLSRAFDLLTWRNPGEYAVSVEQTKVFDPVPASATDYVNLLKIGELAAAPSSVKIAGTTVPSNDLWPWPYNALLEYKPYTHINLNPDGTTKNWGTKLRSIEITGLWGYASTVPPFVYEALLLFVVKFLRKAQENYQDTGVLLDSGQVFGGMKLDEDLSVLIAAIKKPWR